MTIKEIDLVVRYRPDTELQDVLNNNKKMSSVDVEELRDYLYQNAEKMSSYSVVLMQQWINQNEFVYDNDMEDMYDYCPEDAYDDICEMFEELHISML